MDKTSPFVHLLLTCASSSPLQAELIIDVKKNDNINAA